MTRRLAEVTAALAGLVFLALAGCTTSSSSTRLSARDRHWRADISYLASRLPKVHVHGVTGSGRATWNAAAVRLEAEVPRLSDGQLVVGILRLVALLHDDETTVSLQNQQAYSPARRSPSS